MVEIHLTTIIAKHKIKIGFKLRFQMREWFIVTCVHLKICTNMK